ncbi:MAG: hypothetical protein LBU73_08665 [Helicobacteraceae bacterium]|jgi:hypothetical protein|nr:hypothetical protein [Helicobacteraceae bacterium]
MALGLEPKVKKSVLEAIETFLDTGVHRAVALEYTIKKGGETTSKLSVVEDGVKHFLDQGFAENGIKSFIKQSKTAGAKHGYVLFETARLGVGLESVASDIGNIEADLARKTA